MTSDLATAPADIALIAQAADQAAGAAAFAGYQSRKAANTLRRQAADLVLFADFLQSVQITASADQLATDPAAWRGISWGLIAAFQAWQLGRGYAVGSVNVRLATVRQYAALAAAAGAITPGDLALIATVRGYAHKEACRIDEKRPAARLGTKKAAPVSISPEQARRLKAQPDDTGQGRRDALIMALLLDHGLRAGELAALQVDCLDLAAGELRFYRPKVDLTQTHRLTTDTRQAAAAYLAQDAPTAGSLWRRSCKAGELTAQGLTARAITARVCTLGARLGLAGLSAHDCRHFWATRAARLGTPLERLKDAGGWSSLAMPERYIENAKIANDGVML